VSKVSIFLKLLKLLCHCGCNLYCLIFEVWAFSANRELPCVIVSVYTGSAEIHMSHS